MQCPDCGYMMSAFDKDCPRCKKLGAPARQPAQQPAEKEPAAEPPPAPMSAPAFIPAPARAQPSASPAPLSAIPADALACPVCGNQGTQKVSAICEAGTWSTKARSHTTMIGSDGAGHLMMMGGPTTLSSLSQTGLANRLMPPSRPRADGFNGFLGLIAAVLFVIGAGLFLSGIADTWDLWKIGIALALIGAGIAVVWTENKRAAADQESVLALIPAWEQIRVVWNRVFYCGRCDHVYDAQSRAYVPAGEIERLYPPLRPAKAPLDASQDQGKTLGLCIATGAAVILVSASVIGHSARAANAAAFASTKSAFVTQYHALAARADDLTRQSAAARQTAPSDTDYVQQEKITELGAGIDELHSSQQTVQEDLQNWNDDGSDPDVVKSHAVLVDAEISDMQARLNTATAAMQAVGSQPAPVALPTQIAGTDASASPNAPAVVMRTKAGGGDASQFSASGPNVNLPPVTLQAPTPSRSGVAN